jgi:hypothetical protein
MSALEIRRQMTIIEAKKGEHKKQFPGYAHLLYHPLKEFVIFAGFGVFDPSQRDIEFIVNADTVRYPLPYLTEILR